MTEIQIEGGQSYTIPLDSIDMKYVKKYVRTLNGQERPQWTRKCLDRESEYCHIQIVAQDDSEDCYSEETIDTFNCHICDVEVPVLCFKRHNESEKHVTLKTIFQKVLERVSKQINTSIINNDKDIDKDVYYCVPCSKIIKIENKLKHESSEFHVKSQRSINVMHEFYKIFAENKGYVDVKEVENEEIFDEKRDLSANNFGTEIIQTDTKNNNGKLVTNEEKSNNDETKTVCPTNDHTLKPKCTVEHLVRNEKHNQKLTSEEIYFKDMVKKYNLKVDLPIADGEFIHVSSPSGVKVKISQDHFHSYHDKVEGISVYCKMCDTEVELRKETKHKVSEGHAMNVFKPVNEQFARTLNDNDYSHCLICNKVVLTRTLPEHHLHNDNHAKLLNSTQLTDICQNNEDLANVIITKTNIKRTHSGSRPIENHLNKSEENKIIKCVNDKEYISKLNLSDNDLGDHLNESADIARVKDAAYVQKLVFCKLCNVSVPQDQMEYHNAGTPHWSNALQKICTIVADGLQAYFSKDNLQTDSDSSEIKNDTPKHDNVTNQNDTLKNDNVTDQNVTLKNDNITNQNYTLKNDNVTNQHDTLKNDNNITNQKDTLKNDNVTKQNDTLKNDNATNQNDTLKNDNITNQNDTLKNDNVTKQNDALKNDNLAKTSVSNITNNEIDTSSPFRYADSTKNKITCIVCDVDIANVLQSKKKHEASSNHDLWLRQLLKFHSIKKNPKRSFCECCCDINVTNVWTHIGTEQHTALLQLEYVVNAEELKQYVYKSNIRNGRSIIFKEWYKMLLQSNKIYKLPNSHFYCTFCELELSKEGNEIDHMISEAHEKWLKKVFKSR